MTEIVPVARHLRRSGEWNASHADDSVRLDYDDRHRRRRLYTTEQGRRILLDLIEATVLRDGDAIQVEDGTLIAVRAAPEPLIEITAHGPDELSRLAWHLGNRHLPAQISENRILIRDDHVIIAMLRGLGAHVRSVTMPFNPEGGAYGEHNRHHAHAHGQPHEHMRPHDHGHDHTHTHD
ncbi:Urease accessory protein ureE [Granulibacter bethesdensis]|uniref:Urease accessory protein UreE n=1 Tax=Granulibacter bethesdensis TaxID=364410 RepID=A0AAN0RFF4_9PROT|nr:urease accessory protein UreE [Granulibacter bethesdensis]AHJ64063.1 Urease accessory protein ureE [Granulibacter bethesdensis]